MTGLAKFLRPETARDGVCRQLRTRSVMLGRMEVEIERAWRENTPRKRAPDDRR
jgi:hypothetical protein